MRLEAAMRALCAQQQGCVADWQLRDLGAKGTEIARLHHSPRWRTPAPRVLSVVGGVEDDAHRVSAAVLSAGPGAVLSHESAVAWWGVRTFPVLPPTVSQREDRGHRRAQPGVLHDLKLIPDRWVTIHAGVAVVRPELAIYLVCGLHNPLKAERAFDLAWSLRLLSVSSARACLGDLAERGRNGTRVYRAILDARSDKDQPPASSLESRVRQLLGRAGIEMRRQVDVGGAHWDGRIDFRDAQVPLILEVQSEIHHASLTDEQRDRQRHAQYDTDGFEVLAVWENDVWTRGDQVIAQVEEARRHARARQR